MKKLFYSLFSFVLIFLFLLNVNAECSYKERTELLNEAKKVEVIFETFDEKETINAVNPNTGEASLMEITNTYFKMNFYNISENIYIKVINSTNNDYFYVHNSDLVNGVYTYKMYNISDIISYKIEFYSTLDNCYANKLSYTKTVKKPKLNSVYHYSICSNEIVTDSKYCKRIIDTDFTMSDLEIVEYLNGVIKEVNDGRQDIVEKDKPFFELLKEKWYIPTGIVVFMIVIILSIVIIKRRGELK